MKKNYKQFIYDIKGKDFKGFYELVESYTNYKNYLYSRFSGIHSCNKIHYHRKLIRDPLTHSGELNTLSIPPRYARMAIEDVMPNIKVRWEQIKQEIKDYFNRNNYNERTKHFVNTILKHNLTFQDILDQNYNKVNLTAFNDITDKEKIYNKLRTLVRRYQPKISRCGKEKFSMQLDQEMYSYDNCYIYIMSPIKGKRFKFKVNTQEKFNGNIRIQVFKDKIVISKVKEIAIEPLDEYREKIGIDKNYNNCIDSSSGNSYGTNFKDLIQEKIDKLYEKNQKRQLYYDKIHEIEDKEIITNEDRKKIDNIKKFNLGKVKYNRLKNRFHEEEKKFINKSINDLIENEKPSEIVLERLNFTPKKKKKFSKKTNRHLSTWSKGLLNKRIEYKCELKGIKITEVNAAYTSQECHCCHHLGVKQHDVFYCSNHLCEVSKGVESGLTASNVILQRSDDPEINLYTPPKNVRSILLKRLELNITIQPRPRNRSELF